MPFMGFGELGAILSGLLAGRSIALGLDFEEESTPLKRSYTDSLRLRRIMEDMDNQDFDRLVLSFQGTIGQKLFALKRYNILKLGARLAKHTRIS